MIKDEFERVGVFWKSTQCRPLLLFNIGDHEVTAGELKSRGYYQGSNVSYNLKKLVEMGYMHHQRCEIDRRSVRVRLTPRVAGNPGYRGRTVLPPCRRACKPAVSLGLEGIDDITTSLTPGRAVLDGSNPLYLFNQGRCCVGQDCQPFQLSDQLAGHGVFVGFKAQGDLDKSVRRQE